MPPVAHEVLKAVVSEHSAQELLIQRMNVSQTINERLRERFARFNLILDDAALVGLEYSPEYVEMMQRKHRQ